MLRHRIAGPPVRPVPTSVNRTVPAFAPSQPYRIRQFQSHSGCPPTYVSAVPCTLPDAGWLHATSASSARPWTCNVTTTIADLSFLAARVVERSQPRALEPARGADRPRPATEAIRAVQRRLAPAGSGGLPGADPPHLARARAAASHASRHGAVSRSFNPSSACCITTPARRSAGFSSRTARASR